MIQIFCNYFGVTILIAFFLADIQLRDINNRLVEVTAVRDEVLKS